MDWEKIKLGLWGAAGGAAALAIVGFSWGGWVVGGTAEKMASESAKTAVVARLAPICVEQFNLDPMKDAKLQAMKEVDSWNRGDHVGKQGWATMPGEENPDSAVSNKCAEMLAQLD